MRTRLLLVSLILIGVLLAVMLVVRGRHGDVAIDAPSVQPVRTRASNESLDSTEQPQVASTRERAVIAPSAPAATSMSGARRTVQGQVLDVLASPVADVPVVFRPRKGSPPDQVTPSVSDATGHFQIEVGDDDGWLSTLTGPWIAVFEPRISISEPNTGHLLIVVPVHSLAGRIIDERGVPVPDASIRIELPSHGLLRGFGVDTEARASFPLSLDRNDTAEWRCSSDAKGNFSIPRAPQLRKIQLVTEHLGYSTDRRAIVAEEKELTIVLRAPVKPGGHIVGRVENAQRQAVSSARVLCGPKRTWSDEHGAFDIDLGNYAGSDPIVVYQEGWMPTTQPCQKPSALDEGAWPDPLVLVLRDESFTIHGRVIDTHGAAVPDARVSLVDPITDTDVLNCARANRSGLQGDSISVLNRGQVDCASDGTFVIRGLLPRYYRLHVQNRKTLAMANSEFINAGQPEITIVLDATRTFPCVAGQLIHADGSPVPNTRLYAQKLISGGTVTTDEIRSGPDGRFSIDGLSLDVDILAVQPDSISPRLYAIRKFPDPCALSLVVPRVGDIRIDASHAALRVNRFELLDAGGSRLKMSKHFGNGSQGPYEAAPVVDGTSEWYIAPDDAATAVLFDGKTEVMRTSVRVRPGELTVIRL